MPEDVLRDAEMWRTIEARVHGVVGPELKRLRSDLRALQRQVAVVDELDTRLTEVRRKVIGYVQQTRTDLSQQVATLAGSLDTVSFDVVSRESREAELRAIRATVQSEVTAQVQSVHLRTSSATSVDARFDEIERELREIRLTYNRRLEEQRDELQRGYRAAITQLEQEHLREMTRLRTDLFGQLKLDFERLERRVGVLEDDSDGVMDAIIIDIKAMQTAIVQAEQRAVERPREPNLSIDLRRFSAQLTSLEVSLTNKVDNHIHSVDERFIALNIAWRQFHRRYTDWVLARLTELKGCITDRMVLAELLTSMATQVQISHRTAPCVIDPLDDSPAWSEWPRQPGSQAPDR